MARRPAITTGVENARIIALRTPAPAAPAVLGLAEYAKPGVNRAADRAS